MKVALIIEEGEIQEVLSEEPTTFIISKDGAYFAISADVDPERIKQLEALAIDKE